MHRPAALLLLLAASPATAALVVSIGDTTGRPTYNRTLDGFPEPAEFGRAVPFEAKRFTVDAAGIYDIIVTRLDSRYDPFLTVYAGAFDPRDPTANWVDANDDLRFFELTSAGLSLQLDPGVLYFAVTAGFDDGEFGPYSLAVTGPGGIAIVPEPATWTLLIAGFGLVGTVARRRTIGRVSRYLP